MILGFIKRTTRESTVSPVSAAVNVSPSYCDFYFIVRSFIHSFICNLFNGCVGYTDCRLIASNDWMIVNNELERIRKEAAIAYLVRWRRNIPPKLLLTFNVLHGIISQ
jgi:hypothetical protein